MSGPNQERQPEPGDGIVFYGSLMRGLDALDAIPSRDALRYVGPCRIGGELYDLGPYPGLREASPPELDLHATRDTAAPDDATRRAHPLPKTVKRDEPNACSAPVVHAELHILLDTRVIAELDYFEGYEPDQPEASLYLRKRMPLLLPDVSVDAPDASNASNASSAPDPRDTPARRSAHQKWAWVYIYNHTPDPGQRVDSGNWRVHLLTREQPNSRAESSFDPAEASPRTRS